MILEPSVDGKWLEFGEWQICSKECGSGTRTRKQECDGQLNGGKPCEGDGEETQACNEQPCPGNLA